MLTWRFFVDRAAIKDDEALLDAAESHHLSKVLRLAEDDRVILFDGQGTVYEGVVLQADGRARVKILCRRQGDAGGRPLVIAQAILRGVKMDELARQYTELGVNTLMPIWTSRCQGSFDALKESQRQARQLRIIETACKQSGRAYPLRLEAPQSFAGFLADCPEGQSGWRRLMFWEDEETTTLRDLSFADVEGIVALIGPAGGWTPEEAAMARVRGFCTVRLSGPILRAETAGLAAAAICQFLLRNL
ncbi:MAG: 16S rRNA (uracil(1498)-N(3))-methyltransferase [Desulfobulbaceae bacterium]|jgi:16S rRNA (uracil1498-N3)-methyltransferase|nr:16S rRNA (uracil(1498)-N(3))-methyltransferase [Desulfobulbaceae bacterium]